MVYFSSVTRSSCFEPVHAFDLYGILWQYIPQFNCKQCGQCFLLFLLNLLSCSFVLYPRVFVIWKIANNTCSLHSVEDISVLCLDTFFGLTQMSINILIRLPYKMSVSSISNRILSLMSGIRFMNKLWHENLFFYWTDRKTWWPIPTKIPVETDLLFLSAYLDRGDHQIKARGF